jgi:anti-anti-sigma regulatory factor
MKAGAWPPRWATLLNYNLFSLWVVLMATIVEIQKIEEHKLMAGLEGAAQELDGALQELALDFSAVRRIDSRALCALEELARKAEEKKVKVILRGVNVDLYKTFKLIKLASRFSFVN